MKYIIFLAFVIIFSQQMMKQHKYSTQHNLNKVIDDNYITILTQELTQRRSNIPNCYTTNREIEVICDICDQGFFKLDNGRQCQQGDIDKCLEYATETTCSRCIQGYSLSTTLRSCQFNAEATVIPYYQRVRSGIDWAGGISPPETNAIPQFFKTLFKYDGEEGEDAKDGEVTPSFYDGELMDVTLHSKYEDVISAYDDTVTAMRSGEELRLGQAIQNLEKDGEDGDGEDGESVAASLIELKRNDAQVAAFIGMFDNQY